MNKKLTLLFFALLGFFAASAQTDTLSVTLENVSYPCPTKLLPLNIEGQDVKMAYMDVPPSIKANGRSVLLLHGKNFGGYYFTSVINALAAKGFRVIVPDQIGFGRSSKPFINYSFHQLASNNKKLLDTLGISKITVFGHSMGGMLATRFTLMYPQMVEKLLLEDPIGLEDYRTFVLYISLEKEYQKELQTTPESVKKYYQNSYFPDWKPQYEYLVNIAAGVAQSADFPRYAKVAALTYEMIYEQPICYEFGLIKVPTVLFIGWSDRTIVGKGFISDAEKAKHGQYQILGKETAKKIPNCKLIEFDDVGHIPHIQIPTKFLTALLENIYAVLQHCFYHPKNVYLIMHTAEQKKYTEADYNLLEEGAPFQLINGDLIMSPAPTSYHQLLSGRLFKLIDNFLEKNNIYGICLYSPIDVRLDDENTFQPDLIYISPDRKTELFHDKITGAPDLVIEILSPSTAYYDLRQKKDIYERFGVKEYLIVDPLRKDAELHLLENELFMMKQKEVQSGIINFNTLPGLQIDLQKLFA